MTARTVMIQPVQSPDGKLPFPYFIGEDGRIGRQDYWKGDPVVLLGFAARFDVEYVDVMFDEFWADPQSAVGKYAVLGDSAGSMSTHLSAISNVVVHDDETAAR